MFDRLFDAIPGPLLLAVVIYGAIAYFLAPIAAERKLGAAQVSLCEAGARAQEAQARRPPVDQEVALGALEEALKFYEQMPGGRAMADMIRAQIAAARAPSHPAVNHGNLCRCLVSATIQDRTVRTDFALWIGSLKLIAEPGVSPLGFAGHLARLERIGACSREAAS